MKVKFSSVITICLILISTNLLNAQINKPASGKNEAQTTTTTTPTTDKTNSKTEDEKSSFWDKVFFGGNFGFNYINGWLIQVAPTMGYRVSNAFSIAAGINFQYIEYNNLPVSIDTGKLQGFSPPITILADSKAMLYGFNVSSRLKPLALMAEASESFGLLNSVYLMAEGRLSWYNQTITPKLYSDFKIKNSGVSRNLFFGGGVSLPVGGPVSLNFEALYDVLYSPSSSIHPSPWLLRGGMLYGF